MEKDKTILRFIEALSQKIDINLLQVVDYWDADLCAIGFKKGNKLIYISTYNSFNNRIIKYDYDLELIDELVNEKIKVLKRGRAISERQLIKEIKSFLIG